MDLSDLVKFLVKIKQDMLQWHANLSSFLRIDNIDSSKVNHPAILQLQ